MAPRDAIKPLLDQPPKRMTMKVKESRIENVSIFSAL
jgi:hypothetical protein